MIYTVVSVAVRSWRAEASVGPGSLAHFCPWPRVRHLEVRIRSLVSPPPPQSVAAPCSLLQPHILVYIHGIYMYYLKSRSQIFQITLIWNILNSCYFAYIYTSYFKSLTGVLFQRISSIIILCVYKPLKVLLVMHCAN